MTFDVEAVRAQFPILKRQVHGRPLIYLDNAASAQKPQAVIDAITHSLTYAYANVHRGLHTLANEATDGYENGRMAAARLIGASPDEIVFTKGATEAINLVAQTFGRSLKAGDEILITAMEHHANIVPWKMLEATNGVIVKWAEIHDNGALDLRSFETQLTAKTKLVAVAQMSNVLGTVNPLPEIIARAHAAGAKVLIDGCQGVVHRTVNVRELGADFYVFSGHKLYGPTGIGVLYAPFDLLASLPPWQGGGEMIAEVTREKVTYAGPPHRFEAGTPAIVEATALGAAIEWLNGFDRAELEAHEAKLYQRAFDGLSQRSDVQILGTAPGKGAILSFNLKGAHAHDVGQILDRYGVAVRAGQHCAEPLMARFGVTSSVRASFAFYNTLAEVDLFVDALERAAALLL